MVISVGKTIRWFV